MLKSYVVTGSLLRTFRKTCLKMTQEALALRIGIDRATLIRWEGLGAEPLPRTGQAALLLVANELEKSKELMELQMTSYKNYLDKQKLGQKHDDIAAYLPRFNKIAQDPNEADRVALVKVPKKAKPETITASRARTYIWLASDYVNPNRVVSDERLEVIVQGALAQQLTHGFQQGAVIPARDNLFAAFLNENQSLMVLVISADRNGDQVFEHFIEENWDAYNKACQLLPIVDQVDDDQDGPGS